MGERFGKIAQRFAGEAYLVGVEAKMVGVGEGQTSIYSGHAYFMLPDKIRGYSTLSQIVESFHQKRPLLYALLLGCVEMVMLLG